MSLVIPEGEFQYVLRLLNTNVDGRQKVMYAVRSIKGCGRRFSNLVVKCAGIDLNKRAGQLTLKEQEKIVSVIQNPFQYGVPKWFVNRQKDIVDGKWGQLFANQLDEFA